MKPTDSSDEKEGIAESEFRMNGDQADVKGGRDRRMRDGSWEAEEEEESSDGFGGDQDFTWPPRKRLVRERVRQDLSFDPPTEQELLAFVSASQQLTEKGDLMDICMIILQNEPEIRPDEPIVEVDLASLKPKTARALINVAKKTFRARGKSYHESGFEGTIVHFVCSVSPCEESLSSANNS
jgi:hypothetical protein